jgi:hypothetical protein
MALVSRGTVNPRQGRKNGIYGNTWLCQYLKTFSRKTINFKKIVRMMASQKGLKSKTNFFNSLILVLFFLLNFFTQGFSRSHQE